MEDMTYTKAIIELDALITKMQSEDCDIDSLAAYTSRALSLLSYCREKLFKTDEEVKRCLEQLNTLNG